MSKDFAGPDVTNETCNSEIARVSRTPDPHSRHPHAPPFHASAAAGPTELFTDLSPRTVRRLLARTSYTTVQEQQAEMLASLIGTAADRPRRAPSAEVLGQLEAALGVGGPHAH
ncbi:hypothetical protein [Streptomyces caeruleatus]|uniref:hypothetical protein n=1 Tax=Streptomyces caeruleatus TaxID=661399 RepID=UPI000A618F97|nr:hypothetical protein [Streptomyces caeruleatus]